MTEIITNQRRPDIMEIWQAILTAAGTCFATLLVTFIFNWFTNRPKKRREEEAKKESERKKELADMKEELLSKIEEVKLERIAEREACGKDHVGLVKLVTEIQQSGQATNMGLQAVLKDLLKIRYLEWMSKGYAPMDARDDLERMYQAYHSCGGNGVVTELRNSFLELPVTPKHD